MPDPHVTSANHSYLSTACWHNLHGQCRHNCEVCGIPCACSCHSGEPKPELLDVVTKGVLDRAKRRAHTIFDKWNRVAGCLEGSSYQWEVEAIIADAVEIGVQAAYGIHRQLEAERED